MAADWEQVRKLYLQADELGHDARTAFLGSACGGDTELLREVSSLLEAGNAAGSFLESGPLIAGALAAEAITGQRLEHFVLEKFLGQGGMGVVYRARDTVLGRVVAVKFLRPEMAFTVEARRRLLREAQAASALQHPNIVTVFEVRRAGGSDFLVMEFIDGQTLAERLRAGPMPLVEALDCAIQVAAALEAAHGAGILHRDLKPQNVMLAPSGIVKVVDFGLAKLDENVYSQALETRTGAVLGTAAYMSPEQARGDLADARSDLFSFGALLYEMLSGRRAFGGHSAALAVAAVLRDQPEPLDSTASGIILRCLEKDTALRFQTAAELRSALENVREGGWSQFPRRRKHVRRRIALASIPLIAALLAYVARRESVPQTSRTVVRLTSDSGLTTEPALSRDGRLLAYASDQNDGTHLHVWVQSMDGGAARRLTSGTSDQHEPAFSPDGTQICYRSEQDGGGIWTIPVTGGQPKLLMRCCRGPKYSPDGKTIACWIGTPGIGDAAAPGSGHVFIVPALGGPPRQVAPEFTSARIPLWAPDGRHILFEGSTLGNPGSYDWWVADVAGGSMIRTGANRSLALSPLAFYNAGTMPEPRDWSADSGAVLFSAQHMAQPSIFQLAISPRTWKVSGEVAQVTLGSGVEDFPASARGRMVFAGLATRSNLWSLRHGVLEQVTEGFAESYIHTPSLSTDGNRLVGLQEGALVVRDLRSGNERKLAPDLACAWARLAPDGSEVLFLRNHRGNAALYSIGFEGGPATPRSGALDPNEKLWDVSPDGKFVLSMTNTIPRGMIATEASTGSQHLYLSHPRWNVYWARFSSDGNWVVFTARAGPEESRLFAAPFRDGALVKPEEWLEVTDSSSNDTAPCWSPDGKRIYYFSDRDGHRCVWSVAFKNGRPMEPVAVQHFHESRRNLRNVPISYLQIAASQDRLVFNLGELAGNIYMAK